MDQTSQQMGQTNLLKLDKVQNEAILFLLDRRCTGVSTLQDECNRLNSPVPPCCRRVWCVAGLPLATRLFLLSEEVAISAVHVQPSGLQDRVHLQAGDGASFIYLNMWASSRLWPVRSLMTTTCCHRLRKY